MRYISLCCENGCGEARLSLDVAVKRTINMRNHGNNVQDKRTKNIFFPFMISVCKNASHYHSVCVIEKVRDIKSKVYNSTIF